MKWLSGAYDPKHTPTPEQFAQETSWEKIRKRKLWWSFQPIKKVTAYLNRNQKHPVDRFLQHKMAKADLKPSETADPLTVLNDLLLQSLGFPQFNNKQFHRPSTERHAGCSRNSDELLNSPQFGEHGQAWMDWVICRFSR